MLARPTRHEGRIARRHETRAWDAVDAVGVGARREGQGGRRIEPNPVRSSRRAGRTTLSRTAKPCGPGTRCWCQAFAEDASSRPDVDASPISARRRRQEGIRLRGERAISRQSTAQGRPGCFRLRLWFSPCALLAQCSAQGPWVPAGIRSSLRPRLLEGEKTSKPRAHRAARTLKRVHRLRSIGCRHNCPSLRRRCRSSQRWCFGEGAWHTLRRRAWAKAKCVFPADDSGIHALLHGGSMRIAGAGAVVTAAVTTPTPSVSPARRLRRCGYPPPRTAWSPRRV
jgi:hypothetical protein